MAPIRTRNPNIFDFNHNKAVELRSQALRDIASKLAPSLKISLVTGAVVATALIIAFTATGLSGLFS
jgi:hypothetical protein